MDLSSLEGDGHVEGGLGQGSELNIGVDGLARAEEAQLGSALKLRDLEMRRKLLSL